MKNDGRLDRCYLNAGHNLRKSLNKLRLLWLKIISDFRFDGIFYQTRTISRFKPSLMSGLKRYYSG